MHARVFLYITKRFFTVSKTALLALFLFAAVFTDASPAFAQSPEEIAQNSFQLLYGSHLDLFSGSSFKYEGPLINQEKKVVNGFHFTFSVIIPQGGEEIFWKHIADPRSDNDVFIIQSCQASDAKKCAYAKVPYSEKPSASAWTAFKTGLWSNVKLLSTASGVPIASSIEAQYGIEVQGDLDEVLALFKKGVNNNWLKSRAINILAAEWFTINSDGSIKPQSVVDFIGTTSRTTGLWYCGGTANSIDPSTAYKESAAGGGNANVATFGSLCGGKTFFKIAQTQIIPPQSITEAVAQNASIVAADPNATIEKQGDDTNLPTCEINYIGESKIVGCLARIVYYGLYWPLAWVAGLFGSLFDFFIGYSVSDESYRYAFAVNGWKLVRDIANVMFIVIMVYVGFAAVFSFGGSAASTMRRVIPILIFNALIINFSLFATRTVIDISNVTARVFYSRMVVCSGECTYKEGSSTPENIKRGLGGHWPLSEKIVGAFDPQIMFGTITLNPKESQTQEGTSNDRLINSTAVGREINANQQKGFEQDSGEYAGYYALVSIIAAAIMLGIAAMFFNVTFMFIGRVIGLYMAMIFSPFAFLTRGGMPLFNIKGYTWDAWVKDLFNYAALAPVFTFFLYIVYSFLNTDIVKQIGVKDTTGGFFGTVLSIVIPMIFIYMIISKGVSIAKKYSGEFGDMVQGWGNTVSGFAVGAATGGAALVGGRVIGGMAKRIDESRIGVGIRNMASQSGVAGWVGKNLQKGVSATRTGSFDVRQTQLGQGFFKQLGMNTNQKGLNTLAGVGLGLGTDQRKGGVEADIKRREEKKTKIEQLLVEKMSDDDLKGYFEKYNQRKKDKYEKKLAPITAEVEQAMAAAAGTSVADVQLLKTTDPTLYETNRTTALAADAKLKKKVDAIGKPPAEVSTAEGLTADRRTQYAENLKRGGYVTQGLTALASTGRVGEIASTVLGSTVGAAIGNQVRETGNKKAAKKISEKNKISQDLGKIKQVLDKGFKDLIALEKFKGTATYTNLTPADKEAILQGEKSFYDMLTPAEKTVVDTEQKGLTKEKKAEYESKIKAIEGSRYYLKGLQKDVTDRKTDWLNALRRTPPASTAELDAASDAWLQSIAALDKAQKHNKTWADVNKHIEEQKKKLKDEESK